LFFVQQPLAFFALDKRFAYINAKSVPKNKAQAKKQCNILIYNTLKNTNVSASLFLWKFFCGIVWNFSTFSCGSHKFFIFVVSLKKKMK